MHTRFLVLLVGFIGFVIGFLAAIELNTPANFYNRFSYHVRDTLNLEKNWNTLPGPEQANGRTKRNCPLPNEAVVLIIGGQSNAANVNPVPYQVKNDVSVWFDGQCFPASDPMLGATSIGGSLWSVLGDRLEENLSRPILLVVGAVGGTQFSDWNDSRSGYYAALMERVSTARAAGFVPDMILWHQGETDAAAERNMSKLKSDVTVFTNRLLSDIPEAPLYFFQASRCIGSYRESGVPAVTDVLQEVASKSSRIITGMNTDTLGRDDRWDSCHFNSIGREKIVNIITPNLVKYLKTSLAGRLISR